VVVDALYVRTNGRLANGIFGVHQDGTRGAALIRRGMVGTVLVGLAVQLGGPAAQGTPSGSRLGTGQVTVTCPVTRRDPPGAGSSRPPVATGTSVQLQVTVPPLVFVTVESGLLRVSTNTGRPPTTTDGFYLIRRGRAGHAPARVVETVLRSCR
jgi:hypothetical protein